MNRQLLWKNNAPRILPEQKFTAAHCLFSKLHHFLCYNNYSNLSLDI